MDNSVALKLDIFFRQYKNQIFKKGEILIRADEGAMGIYYLTSGVVKQYAISKKGEELIVNVFKPISFFPMSQAFNQVQNTYYYEALEEVDTWRAPQEAVIEFLKNNSDVLFDLMGRVYRGTDGIITRMVYLMSGDAYDRVITELLIMAKRFGNQTSKQTIEVHLTEKELANQAGMARETVSREIKKLKDKGLVNLTRNKLTIIDISKLEDELLS